MGGIVPIRVLADAIEILDQRALPQMTRYFRCDTGADVVAAIQSLAVRGAPAIAIAGLYGLWLDARTLNTGNDFFTNLRTRAQVLRAARPTAVNLMRALDDALKAVAELDPESAINSLRWMADRLAREEQARSQRMAAFGADLIPSSSAVLTHCNTGSLATMGLGTALGVIREAHRRTLIRQVWVDETRPLLQGARLTAWELQQDGIPATLITDSMAASLMSHGLVSAILVGADRIALNGDTANKIGTYGLAVLAHFHGIPFYVVAPMSTFDPAMPSGADIPIEERNPAEVRMVAGQMLAPEHFPAYNPAFDVTPGSLITAIVTDLGVLRPPYGTAIPELVARG